jgi:rubrerythrin
MQIPMLTDDEWREVAPLLQIDTERIKDYRERQQVGLREAMDALRFEACEKYFEITGFRETNPNAILHHRLSDYGSECPDCGHLLRTPRASFCANCGAKSFPKNTEGEQAGTSNGGQRPSLNSGFHSRRG